MGLGSEIKKLVKNPLGALQDALQWVLGIEEPEGPSTKVNIRATDAHIPVIYGERKIAGNIVFAETRNGNKYLYLCITLCEGEIQEIGNIYLNDKLSTEYGGLVVVQKFLGTDTQSASTLLTGSYDGNTSSKWASTAQLKGVAYIAVRLEFNKDELSSLPTITCVVKGKKVYNPFKIIPATEYSTNPVLCLRDYLTNSRYGKGLPIAAIDSASFESAYNWIEDQTVTYDKYAGFGGLGILRSNIFECHAIINTGNKLFDNVKILLAAQRGYMPFVNGKYGLVLDVDVPDGYTFFDFDEDNILSKIQLKTASKNQKYNRVRVKFANKEIRYENDEVIYPLAGSAEEAEYLAEDNNVVLEKMVTLSTVTDQYYARDFARLILKMSRVASNQIAFDANSEALNCNVGDVVRIEHDAFGWTNEEIDARQFYRITQLSLNDDATVGIQAVEYDASIYPWDVGNEIIPMADTALPDPYAIAPPDSISGSASSVIMNDGTDQNYINISWIHTDPEYADRYEIVVYYKIGVEYFEEASITAHVSPYLYRVNNPTADAYRVSIRSVSAIGSRSAYVNSADIIPQFDVIPPSAPTNLAAVGSIQTITVTWENPSDSDFRHAQVFVNLVDEIPASPSAVIDGESYVLSGVAGNTTLYFWVKAEDFSGNTSSAIGSVSATSATLQSTDFSAAQPVIGIDFFVTDLQDKINGAVQTIDYTQDLSDIADDIALKANVTDVSIIENDVAFIRDETLTQSEQILSDALLAHQNAKTLIDAGITTNPSTGEVYIYGLDVLKENTETRLSSAELRLDGAEANINLKASTTYVDQAIATANFDPSQVADLSDLYLRVDQAEIDIDGVEGAILLKVDQTEFDGAEGRLTTAEGEIDVLQGQIVLKATQSDFEALEDRVTDAEIDINALDGASISLTAKDVRRLGERVDVAEYNSLESLLGAYNDRKILRQDLAFAQLQISADVDDLRNAEASARLELIAAIDQNSADLVSEQITRANETSALASDITTLTARVGTNEADITEANTLIIDANSTIAQNKLEIEARMDDAEGAITQINTVDINSESIIAQTVAQLDVDLGDLSGTVTSLSDIVSGEGSIRANDIKSLAVSIGFELDDIHEQSMGTILQNYQSRKDLAAELAIARQSMSADISSEREATAQYRLELLSAIDNSVALINQEATTRANADSAQSQLITELSAEIDTANANIVSEQVARANADGALASDITTLSGRVDSTEGSITQLNFVDVTSTSALVQAFLQASSTLGENTSTIEQKLESENGVFNQYSLTIDNNGSISGFGLVSDIIDGEPTSEFIVNADTFAVGDASYYPFVVYTTSTTIDGVVYPAGVYIKEASIGRLNASNITTGTLSADRIDVSGLITAGSIVVGDDITNFITGSDVNSNVTAISGGAITTGTVVAARIDVAGVITAGSLVIADDITDFITGSDVDANITTIDGGVITTGTINASRISIDNVTLDTDGSGNLIIKGGGVDTTQLALESATSARVATGSKIGWTSAATYYDICSIAITTVANTPIIIQVNTEWSQWVWPDSQTIKIKVLRGTTLVKEVTWTKIAGEYADTAFLPILVVDTPTTSAAVTYKLQAYVSDRLLDLDDATLSILMAKR